jgi:flagellin protein
MEDAGTLELLDSIIKQVNEKQTEIGSIQNRLESVLEQVGIAYENLVSTQSTIRDADISKESSAYIRNQILQQASATLLATANQTPAIALQLL